MDENTVLHGEHLLSFCPELNSGEGADHRWALAAALTELVGAKCEELAFSIDHVNVLSPADDFYWVLDLNFSGLFEADAPSSSLNLTPKVPSIPSQRGVVFVPLGH